MCFIPFPHNWVRVGKWSRLDYRIYCKGTVTVSRHAPGCKQTPHTKRSATARDKWGSLPARCRWIHPLAYSGRDRPYHWQYSRKVSEVDKGLREVVRGPCGLWCGFPANIFLGCRGGVGVEFQGVSSDRSCHVILPVIVPLRNCQEVSGKLPGVPVRWRLSPFYVPGSCQWSFGTLGKETWLLKW